NVVLRQVAGIRRRLDRADQAPAPAEFHRADTDEVHARLIDRTVRLLDQQTFDPAPAEIAGEREADRAGADDQDGNDTFLRHVGIIVTGPAGTTPCNDGLYFLRISLEEFTTACRLRAKSTALGTSIVMARRKYSLTPSVATAGALSMNLHSASTVSSSLASGTTSLTMPWLSARSGPTVAQE